MDETGCKYLVQGKSKGEKYSRMNIKMIVMLITRRIGTLEEIQKDRGRSPEKLFSLKYKIFNALHIPSSSGMMPCKLLFFKLRP